MDQQVSSTILDQYIFNWVKVKVFRKLMKKKLVQLLKTYILQLKIIWFKRGAYTITVLNHFIDRGNVVLIHIQS